MKKKTHYFSLYREKAWCIQCMSNRQQHVRVKMAAKGQPLNERRGNSHTTGQAATGPKFQLYIDKAKVLR